MKGLSFIALAVIVAVVSSLFLVTVASAHAPIKFINWDADTNPTSLTASTVDRMIETAPNSFYLRVYDASGFRVDNGDATVSADQLSITVTLTAGLQQGSYRVDWKTTSTDGAVLTASVPVMLPAANGGAVEEPPDEDEEEAPETAAPAEPSAAPVVVAPPSTGDGGLLSQRSGGTDTAVAVAVASVAVLTAGGGVLAYRRRS